MTQKQINYYRKKAHSYFKKAHIIITNEEYNSLEIADMYLSRFEEIGLIILTYVNTERCCAKEMVLLPFQTCPEHLHPNTNNNPGKEETFRCRYGTVYLYVPGETTNNIKAIMPNNCRFTVFHEIILKPGMQYTLQPNTLHWFQAGKKGAVVSEFSTHSSDETDVFSDPKIVRI